MPRIPRNQVSTADLRTRGEEALRSTAAKANAEPKRPGEGAPAVIRGPPVVAAPASAIGPRTLTVAGVTQRYGWSRTSTYELLGEGKLKGVKMGARLLILVDSCEALLGALPPAQIAPQKKAKRNQGVLAAANEAEA
jgi:hypothetical protein